MKGKKREMNLNSLSTWKGVIKMDLAVRVRHIARQQLLWRAIAVLDLRWWSALVIWYSSA